MKGRQARNSVLLPLAFNLVFRVCGKRKESAGSVRREVAGNRLKSPVLPRFHSDSSRLQRDSVDFLAIAEQSQINSDGIAMDSNLHTCRKRGCDAGRMCEVGPPASGLSFFTCPYSHLAVLNGNPALRGCRPLPIWRIKWMKKRGPRAKTAHPSRCTAFAHWYP